jgi:hypothetical protein
MRATLKASTFAIRTSQRTDQKLQKSLLCHRRQKLFLINFPTLQKKNKNTPTNSPTNTADNDTETQYLQGIKRHDRQKASR